MSEVTPEEFVMPSSNDDRKKIKDTIQELVYCMQAIDDKKSFMKDILSDLDTKFKMPKKLATKLAHTIHKNNYSKVNSENETFDIVYETLYTTSLKA